MAGRRWIVAALFVAAMFVVPAQPAAASCAADGHDRSAHSFIGVVTGLTDDDRVATVRRDDGRIVVVTGAADPAGVRTSVDRTYLAGQRYEFHPRNGDSPYRDNL